MIDNASSISVASSITDSHVHAGEENLDDERDGFIGPELVGRSKQIGQLLGAFQRVLTNKDAEIVFVHGACGSGKTSLVKKLRQKVVDSGGYFTSGKYNQNVRMQEPYSAIMAAFSDLCDIVSQSSDLTKDRRQEIMNALGPSGNLLLKSISNLSGFVNQVDIEANTDETRDLTAYTRFKVACKTFLHGMASENHPLAIFIDDVQWMDQGSRELISLLLRDSELKNVILIFAYRDGEFANLGDMLVNDPFTDPTDIHLGNLDSHDVVEMVTRLMGSNEPNIAQLGRLVASMSKGNPYHACQFLQATKDEGLLTQDFNASSWEFDVDEIQRNIVVSQSLADLLQLKVRRLSKDVQDTLKVASIIGYQFSLDVLVAVTRRLRRSQREAVREPKAAEDWSDSMTREAVLSNIAAGVQHGLIEKVKMDYMFNHDMLHDAFQSMLSSEDREQYHRFIGETFLEYQERENGSSDDIFDAALHLNLAPAFVADAKNKVKLASINLKAAKLCKEASAFVVAAELLRRGLTVIPPESKWEEHFDLSLEMTQFLARIEFIIGNLRECQKITNEALARGRSIEMLVESYLINMEVCMAVNDTAGTILAAKSGLQALGIKAPRRASRIHVLGKICKLRRMIGKKTDQDILNLPRISDPCITAAVWLLVSVTTFLLFQDEDVQAVYYALLASELTMKFGLSTYSACSFACYGIAELFLGYHDKAYRFGKLSMRLLAVRRCSDAECAAVGLSSALLTHWKGSTSDDPCRLKEAVERGLAVGDVLYGAYCLSLTYRMEINSGKNLEHLEHAMCAGARRIRDLGQDDLDLWVQPPIQYVLNMRSSGANWTDMSNLSGAAMDESDYMRSAADSKNIVLIVMAYSIKARLASLFRHYDLAISLYDKMDAMCPGFRLTYDFVSDSFYAAMACYGKYRETRKRQALRGGRKWHKALCKQGSPTSIPFLAFLNAEALSIRKERDLAVVVAAYNGVIETAKKANLGNLDALAHELLGFYLARHGSIADAESHMDTAQDLWLKGYGSIAKSEWLEEKSVFLFASVKKSN